MGEGAPRVLLLKTRLPCSAHASAASVLQPIEASTAPGTEILGGHSIQCAELYVGGMQHER
jgi:hypothetical protein